MLLPVQFKRYSEIVQANQTNLEEQAGLAAANKQLQEQDMKIAQEQAGLKAEQDRIRATPQSEAQLATNLNAVEDVYARRIANLSIIRSAAQGNVTAIKDDAERKTKLLLAPIDNQLEYLKTFGKDNIDYLTQQDQQKLGLISKNLEAKKQETKDLQKAKTDLIMEIANNGGGTNQNLISQINGSRYNFCKPTEYSRPDSISKKNSFKC